MPNINIRCQECSQIHFKQGIKKPDCFVKVRCDKKRTRYKHLEHYRMMQRKAHRYIKWMKEECYLCKSTNRLQGHHVKQQVNGGLDTQDNIMTLCFNCHKTITSYEKALGITKPLL